MSETVVGEVERVTFENEETGFRVVRLGRVTGLGKQKRVVVVGVMPPLGPGARVRVEGDLESHRDHGQQIRARSVLLLMPESLPDIEKYLASGVLPGVGPALARRIVKIFGQDTVQVLDSDPTRLLEVPGLGQARVEEIRRTWGERQALSNLMLAMAPFGITPNLAKAILNVFGAKAMEVVLTAPYRLAISIRGVGFRTADRIARAQGLPKHHPERLHAGALHVLAQREEGGHTATPRADLCLGLAELLELEVSLIEPELERLWLEGVIVIEDGDVLVRSLYEAEKSVAEDVRRLSAAPSHVQPDFERRLIEFERMVVLELAPTQREAVRAAVEEKFVVVTGGPGVGKTTIVKAILATLGGADRRVLLGAPTGRAAKRLHEATGRPAQTLHRVLEIDGRSGAFQRNRENPLECDLLIVDESSMIDLRLMAALLEAVPSAARVVLVGDAEQLPSVGPGSVLRDLIESRVVRVVRLEVIFRQGHESGIVKNSHRVLDGELPISAESRDGDFFVVRVGDAERARDRVVELVAERIPKNFKLDPLRDIQVLTPMHKGEAGTMRLNDVLQERLNNGTLEIESLGQKLRIGDKVIQTKNDYEREVWNGDLGDIVHVDPVASRIDVCFEDGNSTRHVSYEKEELSQLRLAYATTVHKSQGSEYPAVVVVLLRSHFVMLSRNLLYTAMTRAKRLCVLLTDDRALRLALAETRREVRLTHLERRLSAGSERRPVT